MSERYGKCEWCQGSGGEVEECGLCGETGFSGNSEHWIHRENHEKIAREIESRRIYSPRESTASYHREERKFFTGSRHKSIRSLILMEIAVKAFQQNLEKRNKS